MGISWKAIKDIENLWILWEKSIDRLVQKCRNDSERESTKQTTEEITKRVA